MAERTIAFGSQARKKLLSGALKVGKYVGATLGPKGRNGIIQAPYSAPDVTNDGVTIARNIVLPDEIEDLGAQTVVEATMKTNERAGDGTTTTAVIACKIIEVCAKIIDEADKGTEFSKDQIGADVVAMARSIMEGKDIVIEKLKAMAKPVKKGEIKNIISTSLGKIYPEYIETLTELVESVGKDGYISVDDNWGTKYGVESQLFEGLRFLGTYASPFMVNTRHKEAVWENTPILVTNHRIETAAVLKEIINEMFKNGMRKLVIFAEGFEKNFIMSVAKSFVMDQQGKGDPIKVLAVKAPSLTTSQLEDVAAYCGARFIDKNKGEDLMVVRTTELGFAKKVVVNEDDSIITEGKGNVSDRIKLLESELEIERDKAFKEQIKRRIGALRSGFGVVRVGASTDTERLYLKRKIEDAVYAAKAAIEEGVVQGGGLALQGIAKELGKDSILYEAMRAPNEKIETNAGGPVKVPSTVIDPVKVTRLAVENACSVAAQLITAEVAIAYKKESLWDKLDKKLTPADQDDSDFRSEENQEISYRT